jgi:hypothetical protein
LRFEDGIDVFLYLDDSAKEHLYEILLIMPDGAKTLISEIKQRVIVGEFNQSGARVKKSDLVDLKSSLGLSESFLKHKSGQKASAGAHKVVSLDRDNWIEYCYMIGVPNDREKDICTVFEFYADYENAEIKNGFKTKFHSISIRPFLFNFKKWLKKNDKFENITSQMKTLELNNDLRIYLKDFKKNFPVFTLADFDPFLLKEIKQICKTRLPRPEFLMLSKLDFLKYNYHQIKYEATVCKRVWWFFADKPFNLSSLGSK